MPRDSADLRQPASVVTKIPHAKTAEAAGDAFVCHSSDPHRRDLREKRRDGHKTRDKKMLGAVIVGYLVAQTLARLCLYVRARVDLFLGCTSC